MPSFPDQLARLKVAAFTGNLPADLGAWAIAELTARADPSDRRELRDRLLAEAACKLCPGSALWHRAQVLQAEIEALERRRGATASESEVEARQLIAAALAVDPKAPRSVRQLFAILRARI